MAMLGVLFDIDALDTSMYGYAAYRIFFAAAARHLTPGTVLSDGDTEATLASQENRYCIAIETSDDATIAAVKEALTRADAKGLAPLAVRFMSDRLVRDEPLVFAALIGTDGQLQMCETGWVRTAFEETGRG